ncbi:YdiU family protein [Aliikangiella marina]|uniref:Protein nucleotidyltransferase YdiU n=1 Tax=Aliikangiella marina TaxID=1712262 RepID=A0A545TE92_9GAMM|nr:YdiU family protein [Aliikangiella marina]TQV75542.1 YdiU family protein [Aliikangiella marina]
MSIKFKLRNRFSESLPADLETAVMPRQVHNAAFSYVNPTPVSQPQVLAVSTEMLTSLGLEQQAWQSEQFLEIFAGNQLIENSRPYAMCYGGHQFGNWAGQLGDGRAINLAEVVDAQGNNQTLQLKGAGLTPYSRTADGLAVLRSSVREFLCSEAMFHLGIPTTRALSLILTGEQVMRDMFYDGRPQLEPGAIVCRVAPSFVRFGSFQIFASRQETDNLKKLIEHTIRYDFPHLMLDEEKLTSETYEAFFDEVCRRTCEMIVHWMRVGFVHGVMNTDNMSVLGLTIDYGPYGWLEGYDPHWTPNTTDGEGKRYSFGNQPQIAQWNLLQLANTLYTVIGTADKLEESLQKFADLYTHSSQQMYADKLGIGRHRGEDDQKLIGDLFACLASTETDMTIFFRNLTKFSQESELATWYESVKEAFYTLDEINTQTKDEFQSWFTRYKARLQVSELDSQDRISLMNRTNPKYILRNYLAQIAIDKAHEGDYSEIEKLLDIMRRPYDEQPEHEQYFAKRPEWARTKAGCSMLSCSS